MDYIKSKKLLRTGILPQGTLDFTQLYSDWAISQTMRARYRRIMCTINFTGWVMHSQITASEIIS